MMPTLFDPIPLANYQLTNRIFMSPMTRGRAEAGAVPTRIMADYYAAREDTGLLITETTSFSTQAYGWLNTLGIWTDTKETAWKNITKAVHDKIRRTFLQLWQIELLTLSLIPGC